MSEFDAVVIGAGINGMVAAAELAKAGWSVALLEANERIGGFIASEQRTLPGYVHDTFSSWHPLFVSGPAYAALGEELHAHGLRYRNTEGLITASVGADGQAVFAHRDPERTAAGFEQPRDRQAYLAMLERFGEVAPIAGALLGRELRSLRALRTAAPLLRRPGRAERLLRDVASSGRAALRREFDGWEVDRLWTPWLLHAGLAPDSASGGFMLPVLAATLHGTGMPLVEGGAARFIEAFTGLLGTLGVHVRCASPVDRILTRRGRTIGVRVAGQTIRAKRAVLASVGPGALYGELLAPHEVPAAVRTEAARYRPGRAAMQIHVALSGPPRWREALLGRAPLIHISDGAASTGIACAQAEAGLLPGEPTVVVGQQYVLDSGRVPEGAASLWLQLQEVPWEVRGDAAGELEAGPWTPALAHAYAGRVLDRIAVHAPGLRAQVLGMDVLAPPDLLAANRNAVAGDPYGGSAELDQNLLWRPVPSAARHTGVVRGLWHIGAATHPGPGLGGGSGHLVATALTRGR
ncbi:phytoene desaturase family protein [Sciscionella marina]|uniref:phytoene desaturase family protein n=1 Tax=Sciscionella marina TaxID=508770 RepID=UPI00036B5A77|nr:NAD(P)/FAD-dependent oxidoreductase [Sciscionella marina]